MSAGAKIAESVSKAAKTAVAAAKSTPAKIVGYSAAAGGGAYLAMSGVGAGIEAVGNGIGDAVSATGLGNIAALAVPDMINDKQASNNTDVPTVVVNTPAAQAAQTSKGIGTIILVVLIALGAYLLLFKAVPQVKKTLKRSRRK